MPRLLGPGGKFFAAYLHPALGEALAAVDVIVPLVLLAAILRGSAETCERVFRLLRWAANQPEPPGPGGDLTGSRAGRHNEVPTIPAAPATAAANLLPGRPMFDDLSSRFLLMASWSDTRSK
jgi:hypothetical protein